MNKYIGKRFLQLIPVLLGVTFLSFAMMRLAGSDAITELYGDKGAVSQEIIDAKRAELGLDRPFLSQYFSWLGGLLTGDMGTSYVSGRDVFGTFVSKLPATLLLTALSVAATVLLSVPLGILAAVRRDRFTDYFLRFCSFIGNALPNFFVALLLMQVFSIRWRLLPVLSEGTSLRSAVLPTLTLAIAMSAKYMRQVRAAVLEELNRAYVTGARARGIREGVILRGSVLRCAMLTILTLLALSVGSLLGGTAIIESIFQWDGVGKLAVDAITMRDYPMIQAYVVWMAIFVVAPIVIMVVYAFSSAEGGFTLDNFVQMGGYTQVFLRSFKLAIIATAICVLIGYPLAYFMAKEGPGFQKMAMVIIILPMWMNFLLRTYAWMSILKNHGLLNQLFEKIGLISLYNHIFGTELEYFSMMNTQGAVVLGMVYNYLPFMILPIYSVIIKLDRSLLYHICTDARDALFYQSIVSTFQRMGYNVIAEGVETEKEVALLKKWNVDLIQGYYFSRPLPAPMLLELLKEERG